MDLDTSRENSKENFDQDGFGFHRFIVLLKNRIFGINFMLLKEYDTSLSIAILFCGIEFLQMISLIFHEEFASVWGSHEIYDTISQVLGYTRLVTYIQGTNMTVYSGIIYVLLGILIFLLLDSVYASYIFESKKAPFAWLISLMRVIIMFFNSILYLPLLEYLFSAFNCVTNSTGRRVLFMMRTEECGTPLQFVNSILAAVSIFLFILITVLTTLTLFEGRNIPNNPNSKVTARSNFLFNAYKLLVVVILAFLHGNEYRIVHIICIMSGSTMIFMLIQFDNPFYDVTMAKTWSMAAGINLWTATMLVLAKIMEGTTFKEVLVTWLIGIPMVTILIMFTNDKRMDNLLVNVNKFDKGKEIINQVTYLLKLLDSQARDHDSAVLLDGYLEVHKQDCPDDNCPLKRTNKVVTNNKIVRNLLSKPIQSSNPDLTEKEAVIIYIVYQIYRSGVIKFYSDTTLRIAFAFFLLDRMHSKQQALQELTEAEQRNPAFDEEFIIFRYKRIIEDEIAEAQNEKNQKGGLDVMSEFSFQTHLRTCQTNIEKASLLHLEFWSQLSEDQPDLAKLADIGNKINLSIGSVEDHWSKLMKINPNNTKMIRLFGKFIIEVLHDRDRGEELLDKARKITNMNNNKKDVGLVPNDDSADEGTPLIVISGEKDKFAQINSVNLAAASLFGFNKNEVLNKKINSLMPPIFAKHHDSFIDHYLLKNESSIIGINKERFAFGKNKANYIFPIHYTLKAIPSIIHGIQFISTVRFEKNVKNTAYVLTNQEGMIDSISSSCINVLKMDIKHILHKKIKIQDCVPNIITDRASLFSSSSNNNGKTYAQLMFNYPRGSEYLMPGESNSVQINCSLTELTSSSNENVFGFLFGFEKVNERSQTLAPQEVQITNFQFRYEKNRANIIGEFADVNLEDSKEYPKGTGGAPTDIDSQEGYTNDADQFIKYSEMQSQLKGQKDSSTEHEFKKIDYGVGIRTLRLLHGQISDIEADEEKSENGSENSDDNEKPGSVSKKGFGLASQEEEEDEGSLADFGNSEKSKKVLSSVIEDKSLPPNLRNLKLLGILLTLLMVGLSIFDYANIKSKVSIMNNNISNLDASHRLIANIMGAVSGVQDLYLVNRTILNSDEMTLKTSIKTALDAAKALKESLESDESQLSQGHLNLLNNPVVRLSTYDNDYIYKGLIQATEDIITKGLNMVTANLSDINPDNPDYHFLIVNSLNNYYSALVESCEYYAEELVDRTSSDSGSFVVVFVLSIIILLGTLLLMVPLLYSATKARDHILGLFFYIPTKTVKLLYSQCENFVSNLQVGEDDEMTSEIDPAEAERIKEENESTEWMPQRRRRKFKNTSHNYRRFFVSFFIMFCMIEAIFISNFITSNGLLTSVANIATEFNSTSYAEFFYSFSNNVEKQLLINASVPILNQGSEDLANHNVDQMQNLNSEVLSENSLNIASHTNEYNQIFKKIMYQDSCPLLFAQVPLETCQSFADKTVSKGMSVAIVRHFENVRTILKAYNNIDNNEPWPFNSSYLSPLLDSDPKRNMIFSLFRLPQSYEITQMQNIYIGNNYRRLLEQFKVSLGQEFDSLASLRLFMFILFIFLALGIYLFLWVPMVSLLNNKLWRTKIMLKMIPISVMNLST